MKRAILLLEVMALVLSISNYIFQAF